jgi:hypothetical protein
MDLWWTESDIQGFDEKISLILSSLEIPCFTLRSQPNTFGRSMIFWSISLSKTFVPHLTPAQSVQMNIFTGNAMQFNNLSRFDFYLKGKLTNLCLSLSSDKIYKRWDFIVFFLDVKSPHPQTWNCYNAQNSHLFPCCHLWNHNFQSLGTFEICLKWQFLQNISIIWNKWRFPIRPSLIENKETLNFEKLNKVTSQTPIVGFFSWFTVSHSYLGTNWFRTVDWIFHSDATHWRYQRPCFKI